MNDSQLTKLRDKVWRVTNLYKIRDKKKQLRKLKPFNRIQLPIVDYLLDCDKNKRPYRHFTLKYRQGGVSTLMLIWYLDDTIFHPNTVTGILADKQDSLNHLWDSIVKIAFDNMKSTFKPRVGDYSKSVLSFPEINSKMFISLSIKSTGLHNLHISEWCFCRDEVISQSLGATSPDANITGETTPANIGGDGYITYQDAKTGENGYTPYFIRWWQQDEYRIPTNGAVVTKTKEESKLPIDDEQILFRRERQKSLKTEFLKYYPEDDVMCWLMAGDHFFDQKKILTLIKEAKDHKPVQETEDFVMWHNVERKHRYVAGADTAEGIDGDYSVLKILDVTDPKEVFRFRARCGVDRFYKICDEWCRYYNTAYLGVERNNHGHAVLLGLVETSKYPNLYEEKKPTRIMAQSERKYGWLTNNTSRPIMLDHFKLSLEGDSTEDEFNFAPEYTVHDIIMLRECLTFQNVDGKFEASTGYHDDDIFASAIAYQLFQKVIKRTIVKYEDKIFLGNKREATI